MITVSYNGESFTCATALKGADYIHLLDDNGAMITAFDGISDFSGFSISDGTWTTPTAPGNCYVATVGDDGVIRKGTRKECDIPITTVDGTVTSQNADYAEVGEWADGNVSDENRIGYFVAVDPSSAGTTMVKANADSDVHGVTVTAPAFSGGCSADKFGADGNLLKQYDYVAVMGIVSVIDNGTCTINGRCMPAADGTAIPSTNNLGYQVIDRIDDTHVLIAVEPGADMIQRIKEDMAKKADLNTVAMLSGAGEPADTTVGAIGQCYYDTEAEEFYKCVLHIVDGGNTTYMWAKMGSGSGNEAAFGTRGPIIIRETQTLDLSQYGLKVGDSINVVCIGGGGGGGMGVTTSSPGGAAGKAGGGTNAGGGGGGIGAGGGGGGGDRGSNRYVAGAGGGGGYAAYATVTLTSTSVVVTIGSGGKGGTGTNTAARATAGGTTSFGSYLSANGGGAGGSGGSTLTSPSVGGVGGHSGGNGTRASNTSVYCAGGGGGGGWVVESFTLQTGSDGVSAIITDSDFHQGGPGGTDGGRGGNYIGGVSAADGNGSGNGAVYVWY